MPWSRAPAPKPRAPPAPESSWSFALIALAAFAGIIYITKAPLPTTTSSTSGHRESGHTSPSSNSESASSSSSAPKPPITYPTFSAAKHYRDGKYHLLLCATGSVATIKIPSICQALATYSNLSIRVLLSPSATTFLSGQSAEQPHWGTLRQIQNVDGVYVDRHEWARPWKRGENILHIELRRWADLMVVAPLSANALSGLAEGRSDSLILSVARAWDTDGLIDGLRPGIVLGPDTEGKVVKKKTIMVAPAMNTAMWRHPATAKHLGVLTGEWGVQNGGWIELLAPIEKGLACGDAGSGGMKEWKSIVEDIERKFPRLRKVEDADDEGRKGE